jgi:hypothetical protein
VNALEQIAERHYQEGEDYGHKRPQEGAEDKPNDAIGDSGTRPTGCVQSSPNAANDAEYEHTGTE